MRHLALLSESRDFCWPINTVFENHRKSLIQYCERSELRIYTSSLKRPKMGHFGEFLKTWSLRSNSVTRQISFKRTKIGGKCQNWKIQVRHFSTILIDLNAINQYGITAFYIYACVNGHTDDVDFNLVLFINIELSIL